MQFLPDLYVTCEECQGQRFNRQTLEVRFKGKSIGEVLEMRVDEARAFFDAQPRVLPGPRRAARRRAGLPDARPVEHDALRRRGPAHQAGRGARPGLDAAGASTSWTSRPRACTSPTSTACSTILHRLADLGNTRRGHRAQPRRHRHGRLGDRPGPRRRRGRRKGRRHGTARQTIAACAREPHRRVLSDRGLPASSEIGLQAVLKSGSTEAAVNL